MDTLSNQVKGLCLGDMVGVAHTITPIFRVSKLTHREFTYLLEVTWSSQAPIPGSHPLHCAQFHQSPLQSAPGGCTR